MDVGFQAQDTTLMEAITLTFILEIVDMRNWELQKKNK